jgi:hypothetical protein
MGAEREDTDPTATKRAGTEPGLGKSSGATPAAAVAPPDEEDAPPPVDFDALHAALGDPMEYEEPDLEPLPDDGSGVDAAHGREPAIEAPPLPPGGKGTNVRVGESSGRSSATYASARPHTIPPTRAPAEDPNAPAVIVAGDTDTVPSAPPQMTVPLASPPGPAHGVPPYSAGADPMAASGSNPQVALGQPSSGSQPAAPSLGVGFAHTPQPFAVQAHPRGAPQMTMRMPDRPVNPRRGKTPTIVVRARGPSTKQRLLVFMTFSVLVIACGMAMVIWRMPHLVNLEPFLGTPAPTTAPAPAIPPTPGTATTAAPSASAGEHTGPTITPVMPITSAGASASPSVSASAAASASAKKPLKPLPPRQ